ncbi:putative bifunctional diguanylate cyclase/phosphodiesterase [Paraburkholderia caballeronis]|uniref:Diguanylate cyclase (GGDEF) domain-containing protein n=1 Tax=Paraburkholderia caballeronis TaxID=416943 RepID=A0A1H7VE90_9BURK|nr:EAL domain-containing protein [Paraburkholderia caballeronis]PXW16921.1 diguanylate cyclase (GGDEF)-like protein [Paraburkholderia caballeronis]PXW94631.1 diguanylate cyclase (GGDEF)-like protein [Paraburkholderia caballeronis]RAJ89978.1 diguanylate cyclase (GGDEF)-like protein [Paraburkholderia caballeronis]TDV05027.1 diguanylate cyclase (GGDEF)-like protein [Paraburkholderia caballeronis]TDV19160.1 diguanylate cyclase (GGDEF)-like protein [Paraburkholderia caballeronis]
MTDSLHHGPPPAHESIVRNPPLPQSLAQICTQLERTLGADAACSIRLLDDDRARVGVAVAPSLPTSFAASFEGSMRCPPACTCGVALETGRFVADDDAIASARSRGGCRRCERIAIAAGIVSCWAMPVLSEAGSVLGVLSVHHRVLRRPTRADETAMLDTCRAIGFAIQRDAIAHRLSQDGEYHRLVINHLHEGVVVQTPAGVVLACNPSAQRILREQTSLVGRHVYSIMTPAFRNDGSRMPEAEWPINRVLTSGQPVLGETIGLLFSDGAIVWIKENVVPIVAAGESKPGALLISFNDVGPVRDAHQRLMHLATRDPLTGLFNRAYLLDRMHTAFDATPERRQTTTRAAVLFIDLDGFKKVNDTAGHAAGDSLLRAVADRLTRGMRRGDTLARVGGDEFVVLVHAYNEVTEIVSLCEWLLDAIAQPFQIAGSEFYLGASIGISLYPDDGNDGATLMRNADSAMFEAKERGRNRCQFFTSELRQTLLRRIRIEQLMRQALADDEFTLVYQPVVSSNNGQTVAAEALLRWNNSTLGPVSPVEFIPIAEESGLIVAIGDWVLEHACAQAAEWRRTIAPDLQMSVNLSPRQLTDDIVDKVRHCLARTGLEPAGLELEITEGVLMAENGSVFPTLSALTQLGVRITLDDFGTGYSSLSYLKRFPVQCLKIDRSFVAELTSDRDSVALTKAIIVMAHALGIEVTAEGVETPEQSAFLRAIRCDRQQGYLFGYPLLPVQWTDTLVGTRAEMQISGGDVASPPELN